MNFPNKIGPWKNKRAKTFAVFCQIELTVNPPMTGDWFYFEGKKYRVIKTETFNTHLTLYLRGVDPRLSEPLDA